jgi:hypothetical protein
VGTSLFSPFVPLVRLLLPWCRKTVIRDIYQSKFVVIIFHTHIKNRNIAFYSVRRFQQNAKARCDLTANLQWLERNWGWKDKDGNCKQGTPNYFVTTQAVLTGQAHGPAIFFRGSVCTNSAALDICTCRSSSVKEFQRENFQPKWIKLPRIF